MASASGDYIGGGTDRLWDRPGTISIAGGLGHVEVRVSGEAGEFSFDFSPPSGSQLETREYTGAQRDGFQPAGVPGLDVSGDGRGCNEDFGRFIVKDIHVDGGGNVDRFWTLFEQHCENPHAAPLFGEVRLGEPPPEAPETVEPSAIDWPTTWVGSAGIGVPVTVVAGESGAHVTTVGVEGVNAGDFVVSSDGCEGAVLGAAARCQLSVKAKPTAPGDRAAELVITDSSGAKTFTSLAVHAEPLLEKSSATMVSTGVADWIGKGEARLFTAPPGAVYVSGGLGHVEVSAAGEAGEFTFDFAPPSGSQLEVGEYTGAQRYPFEPKGVPGLSVAGNGRGCNTDYGRFNVKDIQIDGAGKVDRFWALYEQHCEGPEAPPLFGEVRVGEPAPSAPEAVEPAAIDWPTTLVSRLGATVPVTVIGGESGADVQGVAVEGADAGDFSVTSDGCEGTVLAPGTHCQLAIRVGPTASGHRVAVLKITDASSAASTVPLEVQAEAAAPAVSTEPATSVAMSAATLKGTVTPSGDEVTDCHFDYGPTSAYGDSVACGSLPGAGSSPVSVSAPLSTLAADATYHFRLVATNSHGTSVGTDQAFTTVAPVFPSVPLMPTLGEGPRFETPHPQALPDPNAVLASKSLAAAPSGIVVAPMSCPAAVTSCSGTITLTTLAPARTALRAGAARATVITLARAGFTVAGGAESRVELRLSAKARRMLAHRHVLRARSTVVSRDAAGTTDSSTVVVTIRAAKRHRRHFRAPSSA
jgi:hypothetical protein